MKRILLLIFALSFININAQQFEATPDGLRDKNDNSKSFLVIDVSGVSAADLYKKTKKYINETYKNPDKVIKGDVENDYIRFSTYTDAAFNLRFVKGGGGADIGGKFITEVKFKDGKAKFEIISIDFEDIGRGQNFHFKAGMLSKTQIYRERKGEVTLFNEKAKTDIEAYFNGRIDAMKKYMLGENESDNWYILKKL